MAVALFIAVTMVLSVGMVAVSFATGALAGPLAKIGGTENSPQSILEKLTPALHTGGPTGSTLSYSSNWAGYAQVTTAAKQGTIYEVMAEWYVPTITCTHAPAAGSYQVSWVGIDGYGTPTVEQLGSLSYCATTGSTPAYLTWYEFYPYNDITEIASSSAGAFVQATVLYNPAEEVSGVAGVFTLELYDVDNGVSFVTQGGGWICNTNSVCEGGLDGSAECISEAPASGTVLPLADYKSTTFYACAVTVGTHFAGIGSVVKGVTLYKIEQVGGTSGKIIQTTSGLSTYFYGKSDFTIKWHGYD